MRIRRAQVTPNVRTVVFVGHGSMMVTVLSVIKKTKIFSLLYLFLRIKEFDNSYDFFLLTGLVEIYASVALQEFRLLLVTEIENENFLR